MRPALFCSALLPLERVPLRASRGRAQLGEEGAGGCGCARGRGAVTVAKKCKYGRAKLVRRTSQTRTRRGGDDGY